MKHYVINVSVKAVDYMFKAKPTFSFSWFWRDSAVFTPLSLSLANELCACCSSSPKVVSSASLVVRDWASSVFSVSRVDSCTLRASLDWRGTGRGGRVRHQRGRLFWRSVCPQRHLA